MPLELVLDAVLVVVLVVALAVVQILKPGNERERWRKDAGR